MFKGLGNISSLLKQAQEMGSRMQGINDELRTQRAEASVGGGMVKVEVNGVGEVLRLEIDPTLIERGEREMLEDLIPAAVNQALVKAKQLHADAMQSITSDIDLPGLNETLAKFTGGNQEN